MAVTKGRILSAVEELSSEDGESSEYDRALVEMACELLGMNQEDKYTIARLCDIDPTGWYR